MRVRTGSFSVFLWLLLFSMVPLAAQGPSGEEAVKSQEISEEDGLPVILHHLPDLDSVRDTAAFINSQEILRNVVGERPVLAQVTFDAGTEAASARYPDGQLLIIEYMTPQAASEADSQFLSFLTNEPEAATVYKRIGNYAVFVFDGTNVNTANELADRVQYQKSVQWLGEDPFLIQKFERYFAITAGEVVISSLLWISLIFGTAISMGVICGILYFRFRERKRHSYTGFSDAGGMTRLNLDDLS